MPSQAVNVEQRHCMWLSLLDDILDMLVTNHSKILYRVAPFSSLWLLLFIVFHTTDQILQKMSIFG